MSEVDYRVLLVKYVQLVREEEGVTFIDRANDYLSEVEFTDAEVGALRESGRSVRLMFRMEGEAL